MKMKMCKTSLIIIFLCISRVKGRVASNVDIETITSESDVAGKFENLIAISKLENDTRPLENNNKSKIQIDLPVYEHVDVNIIVTPALNSTTQNINKVTVSTTQNPESKDTTNKENNANKEGGEKYQEPLILTPLIKRGKTNLARTRSKVNSEVLFGLPSHSGFLTVDEKYNSNLFFWYFPVPDKPVDKTPLIIWLQGGPGVSSMFGALYEIGPVLMKPSGFVLNNETWGKEHSLLFIENPVGTGFSFTNSSEGFAQLTSTSSAQLYDALQQFLEIFPELRQVPLFVAGESYAGKYVPGLAMEIHRNRESGQHINLKGIAIGNGFIVPSSVANYSRIAYNYGILDPENINEIERMDREFLTLVKAGDNKAAKKKWAQIVVSLASILMQDQIFNILQKDHMLLWTSTRLAHQLIQDLHVGALPLTIVNGTVNSKMVPDFLANYKPVVEELLEYYQVLIYNGHLDLMVPYVLTAEDMRTWQWSGRNLFLQAKRHSWAADRIFSGFSKSGGNLTEVLVWNAGHTVPVDQPQAARVMIEAFTSGRKLEGQPKFPVFDDDVLEYLYL